jgi:hypothetical protein
MLIVAFIFINLFIAVILQGFEQSEMIESSMMNSEHLATFKKAWVQFDPSGEGFILAHKLHPLLRLMPTPLGYANAPPEHTQALQRYIDHCDIPLYMENKYHFFDI